MKIYDRKTVKPKKFPWFYFICHLKHVIYINIITFSALVVVSMTKRVKNNNFWFNYNYLDALLIRFKINLVFHHIKKFKRIKRWEKSKNYGKKSSFKVLILTFNFRFYHIWRALDNFCQRILCLSVWELCHIMWHLNGVMWRYPCCNMTFFNKIPSKKNCHSH